MSVSLADLLPDASWDPSGDVLLGRFLEYTTGRRLTLNPALLAHVGQPARRLADVSVLECRWSLD
jgi:hypothetical protein